jgi:hypothetical protein
MYGVQLFSANRFQDAEDQATNFLATLVAAFWVNTPTPPRSIQVKLTIISEDEAVNILKSIPQCPADEGISH